MWEWFKEFDLEQWVCSERIFLLTLVNISICVKSYFYISVCVYLGDEGFTVGQLNRWGCKEQMWKTWCTLYRGSMVSMEVIALHCTALYRKLFLIVINCNIASHGWKQSLELMWGDGLCRSLCTCCSALLTVQCLQSITLTCKMSPPTSTLTV